MNIHAPYLFKNGKTSKNRLVLAPMTNTQSHEDGTLGSAEQKWLESTAEGGFGLILTCASFVCEEGKAWQNQLGSHNDKMLPGLSTLAQALKPYGSLNLVQLFHGGVRCPSQLTGKQPVSASEFELSLPNFEKPRALTVSEIESIIDKFAQATKRAYQSGFDGVEIHGANGYLITQFISTQTNLRKDNYGGSVVNRARFVREIMQACRKQVPSSFLIGVRLSPENKETGLDLDENLQIAEWLIEDGADFIDISSKSFFVPSQKYSDNPAPLSTYFRKRVGSHTLIAGGQIYNPSQAQHVLEAGGDLVYLGTIAIGNNDWPKQSREPDFLPVLPPYSPAYLREKGISDPFICYMRSLSAIMNILKDEI